MKARKMMVSALAVTLVAGSSALAWAAPGQKGDCNAEDRAEKRVERMASKLELDEAQQASLKVLFADRAAQQSEKPRKPRATLAGLDPNAADYQQQVKQQISEMQQQLAERVQARADFKASLYAILTPEQEQKLAELHKQKRGKHERKGHRHEGPRHER